MRIESCDALTKTTSGASGATLFFLPIVLQSCFLFIVLERSVSGQDTKTRSAIAFSAMKGKLHENGPVDTQHPWILAPRCPEATKPVAQRTSLGVQLSPAH